MELEVQTSRANRIRRELQCNLNSFGVSFSPSVLSMRTLVQDAPETQAQKAETEANT